MKIRESSVTVEKETRRQRERGDKRNGKECLCDKVETNEATRDIMV